jgi:hypothetical protein
MNGYGTIEQIYRPLGIATIKPGDPNIPTVIFTASAVQGGPDAFQHLREKDKVDYRVFADDIGGAKFARDVWKK